MAIAFSITLSVKISNNPTDTVISTALIETFDSTDNYRIPKTDSGL